MISVLYYTNNLLSKSLLSHTLKETIKHCRNNSCELILTSPYPLSEKYENVNLSTEIDTKNDPVYNYLVKQPIISQEDIKDINCKIFVVGKLPYSYLSIFKQIILSIEKCKGENIILIEHDCLYPETYIPAVKKALVDYGKDFSYCNFATCFLNKNGFFKMSNGTYCMSNCAGKKKLLMDVLKRKIELMENNKPYKFEPIIDILDTAIKAPKDELIISNHICIDTFMKDGCVLDIKHGLNSDGFLSGGKYFHQHPYWGEDKKYTDMITNIPKGKWNYGIAKFDY